MVYLHTSTYQISVSSTSWPTLLLSFLWRLLGPSYAQRQPGDPLPRLCPVFMFSAPCFSLHHLWTFTTTLWKHKPGRAGKPVLGGSWRTPWGGSLRCMLMSGQMLPTGRSLVPRGGVSSITHIWAVLLPLLFFSPRPHSFSSLHQCVLCVFAHAILLT